MIASDVFFDSITELTDYMSSQFSFQPDVSDSSCDIYQRVNDNGITEVSIDYAQEIVFISHLNTDKRRTINIEYKHPTKDQVNEIAECISFF